MFGSNYFASSYFAQDYFFRVFGQTFNASLNDVLGLTDTTEYQIVIGRMISDVEGVSDFIDRTVLFLKSINDAEGITDVISRAQMFQISLSDILGITDSLKRMITMNQGGPTHNTLEVIKPSSSLFIYKSLNKLEEIRPEIEKLIKT